MRSYNAGASQFFEIVKISVIFDLNLLFYSVSDGTRIKIYCNLMFKSLKNNWPNLDKARQG